MLDSPREANRLSEFNSNLGILGADTLRGSSALFFAELLVVLLQNMINVVMYYIFDRLGENLSDKGRDIKLRKSLDATKSDSGAISSAQAAQLHK